MLWCFYTASIQESILPKSSQNSALETVIEFKTHGCLKYINLQNKQ